MQLLIISAISTIIVSIAQIVKVSKEFIKYIYDQGYKIDSKRLKSVNQYINNINNNTSKLYMIFVPYYNLLYTVEFTNTLENRQTEVLNAMFSMGVIDKMNDYEEIEYSKNPKFSTGLLIEETVKNNLIGTRKINIKDGFKEGELIYKGKEIIYATRFLKEKSNEELLEILNNANRELIMNIITEKYGSVDYFCDMIKENAEKEIVSIANEVVKTNEYNYTLKAKEQLKELEEKEQIIVNKLGKFKIEIDMSENIEEKDLNNELKERIKVLKKERK